MAKQAQNNSSDKTVKGEPTKDFFISMLIKDITLRDAIGDLVDNSVDAIKAKAKNPDVLKGYTIDINLNEKQFSIKDNGSGIEEQIARDYAFKLGKPEKHKLISHSIGRFGIGMKRAFFKLGETISVNSVAPTSNFKLEIPVKTWKADDDNWDFKFESVGKDEKNDEALTGTYINVRNLSFDAKENFKSVQFENELKEEIAREQLLNIHKGIQIKINGETLIAPKLTLKRSEELKPLYWTHTFRHDESNLDVEILAGVSDEKEDEGGWNIFCNDRLILSQDTSSITGWTGSGGDGVAKYHQQFWGFRGYVFFNSEKSSVLPWNTTKTGIDPDSTDYLTVRSKMIEFMKDVILLLNRQKKEREKENPIKDQILNNKIKAAKAESIISVVKDKKDFSPVFVFPREINAIKDSNSKIIRYQVPTVKFNEVKKRIGAANQNDVGSKTFDYYYDNEVGN